ncbi:hypothetical protein QQ020_23525 [Fulvivirgaceae bacterium BMA12]|uniref:Uncharacterized protein n=1 Tax=Agaribacillus aureus TaxID=3051825 RepID=A0ABT8LDM8_9BACT|nr:hypothetical protein [Fulvivirgaceae bacterium BMA12]
MEEQKNQKKSIWGRWWEPLRKWFYPAWLMYETSYRFYEYAQTVHQYFNTHRNDIGSYIGNTVAEILNTFCSGATFVGCSAFLTVPACFVLYKFFKEDNLSATRFEERLKVMF